MILFYIQRMFWFDNSIEWPQGAGTNSILKSLQLKSKIFIVNIFLDNFKYEQIYYSIYDGKCLGSPMLLLFLV